MLPALRTPHPEAPPGAESLLDAVPLGALEGRRKAEQAADRAALLLMRAQLDDLLARHDARSRPRR